MKDNIDLTVCITTYNLENVIEKCLESVFAQKTDYSFEVLIGDDGSSDGTLKIIKEWKQKYPNIIQYFVMDRIEGKVYNTVSRASKNRTNLLRHSSGRYITFLDGDDFYISENKFQKQLDILEQNPQCSICAHNMNIYKDNKVDSLLSKGKIYAKRKILDLKYFINKCMYVHAESCIIRNKFLEHKEFDKYYDSEFDDTFIIYEALLFGKMYYIPDVMANYRMNAGGYEDWDILKKSLYGIIGMDMRIKLNKKYKWTILTRYFGFILNIKRCDKKALIEKYPSLYDIAKNNNAEYTLKLIDNKFSNIMLFILFIRKVFIKIGNIF